MLVVLTLNEKFAVPTNQRIARINKKSFQQTHRINAEKWLLVENNATSTFI